MIILSYPVLAIIIALSGVCGFLTHYLIMRDREKTMLSQFNETLENINRAHPRVFDRVAFEKAVDESGPAKAISLFEGFFVKDFSKFPFSREQLRAIANTVTIGDMPFPRYLRVRAFNEIALSVKNLAEAIDEYKGLAACRCLDGNQDTINTMVTRLIKNIADCDYVIENVESVHMVHQFAQNKKKKLQDKAVL